MLYTETIEGVSAVGYRMSVVLVFLLGLVGLIFARAWNANSGALFDQVGSTIVIFAIGLCGGLTIVALRKRKEKRELSAEPDSVEAHAAQVAQAKVFVDGVVGGVVLAGVWGVLGGAINPGLPLFVFIALLVIDFWIRFAAIKRRLAAAIAR